MNISGYNTDNIHVGSVLIEGNLTIDGEIFKNSPLPPPDPTGVFNPLDETLNANNYRITNLGATVDLKDAINKGEANSLYLSKSGGVMSGIIYMNNNVISNLGTAIDPTDAISKGQSDTLYLAKAGGTMTGDINMGSRRIINCIGPLSGNDVVTRNYLQSVTLANPATETQNMNNNRIINLPAPLALSEPVPLSYFQTNALMNPASATLNMNNNRIINVPLALSLTDAVSVNYLQANALLNPANANLNMNNFEIQEVKTIRGRNNVPLNIILGSGGSLSISGGEIFCGNSRIGSVSLPLFGDDVATKDYVDGLIGSPGKLRFINSVADLGIPISIDGQLRYVIPNDITYYFTSSLTITYGFSFGINTEITGNQNISITFNESINDITGFYSRNQNTTITSLTFIFGGGNFAGFNDINNVQKGLFDCIDLTNTKRFRLLNCNFTRARRFGVVLGYDNVNINDNVIDGGASTKTWYNSLVSTQPLFMDDYPYKVSGSNLELIANSSVIGNVGSITSVDIYKRGTDVLPQQYTFIDDNGYAQEQTILVPGNNIEGAKYGTYMDTAQNWLVVSFQDPAGSKMIYLNIFIRTINSFFQLHQSYGIISGVVDAETPISISPTIIALRLYDGAKYVIFIYNLIGATWTKTQEVTTNNINWGRYSIKVLEHPNGNAYLIVGYPGFAINGGFGAVNIYERLPGGSFILNGTRPNPGLVLGLEFGKYVSADRNMLMTSASNNTVYITRNYAIVMGTFIETTISSPEEDRKSFGKSIDVQYNVLDGEYRMLIGDPAFIEANVISNVITAFTTGKLYVYYYRSNNASTNTNDLLLEKTQEISVPSFLTNLNNNIGFTTALSFAKFSQGESFVVGSTAYNNSSGNTALYRYKDNKYFLGQLLDVPGVSTGDFSGSTVLSCDDVIFIGSPNYNGNFINQGRISRFRQGSLFAQGSIVISNATVGEIGQFSKSGLCVQDSNTLEYNNNNTYAFSGTQDPFTTASMLYFIAPSYGGINAVTIDGNIFSPQNLENAIEVDPTNIINLATITGNTFIKDGGSSSFIKYRDSDTIKTFNHPSVQKFEIESNAGEINSTPILRHILGLSQQLQGSVWSPITYLTTEVNGIFDNSKRFAVRCQIQSTRQFQVGNYIKPNEQGQALIVYAEPITNATYQCYWITDFTGPITSGGFNTNIQEVAYNDPTVISTGSNFRLGVLTGNVNSFYEYVYIDKDPKDMVVSCSLSFTGDTLNRTHVFRINFASDGINYLNDASLETYTVITRVSPEVLNITLVDSFKFVYGSKFKIEQKQNTTTSSVRIRDGIITAQ